jgi:hypothetical protein
LASRALLAAFLGSLALLPATAHAGSYDVYSCKFGPSFYGNNAWVDASSPAATPSLTTPDKTCASAGDALIALLQPAAVNTNNTFAAGNASVLRFGVPADTRITDFALTMRQRFSTFTNDGAGNHTQNNTGYTLFQFGSKGVTLTGSWDSMPAGDQTAINAEKHWFGTGGPVDSNVFTLTKADSPQALKQGTATLMQIAAGCFAGSCVVDDASVAQIQLLGSKVTIEDLRPPVLSAVRAGTGLLAPGVRSGDEPVTFSAADNSGIRRAEIVDVTDTANPVVVASEDYESGPNTDDGTRCDFTRPRPCPDLTDETISASPAIAGHRTLLVRVTDAGGDTAVSAPFSIVARGPINGTNGGDGARVVAGFPAKVFRGKGKKRHAVFVLRPRHTVSYGKGARVRGTLKGANGQPVDGADLRILVREDRLGARYVDRGGVTTGPDGRVQFNAPAGNSRFIRLGYRAYKGDDNYASRSTAALSVRARISAHGPRRVRRHGVATFAGRLVGRPFPPRGVTLDLQIFQPHVGWRVFGNTRTRKNGHFRIRYRFQPASQGRFTFRLRLRPNDAYPYTRGFSGRMRVRVG